MRRGFGALCSTLALLAALTAATGCEPVVDSDAFRPPVLNPEPAPPSAQWIVDLVAGLNTPPRCPKPTLPTLAVLDTDGRSRAVAFWLVDHLDVCYAAINHRGETPTTIWFSPVEDLVAQGTFMNEGGIEGVEAEKAIKNLIKALGKGVLKVMSKMGISTVASYRGAQVFEAIGLSQELVDRYFAGTTTKLGGIGLEEIARETAARHAKAYPASGIPAAHRALEIGGEYQWRREGEPHLFDPDTVFRLQHSTRNRRYDIFKQYTDRVNEQSERLMTLRGLFRLDGLGREPIPVEEVEPVSEIVKRFSTGAMSYGSISREAHETLAIAMNRLGGKSNTGEGGEDPDRLYDPERRSAIKQVASGRFGVTSEYLVNADDIQIKMAQGAKPGEGGQLPVGRPDQALHPGRRPDLSAAAPRHLLDRGPGPADPRPQERQPGRPHPREAGVRGRRRDGRGRRVQGTRRRRPGLRARRRHRRLAAHLAQARGRPLGARPRRDPADPAAQRVARPHRGPDRRPTEDRP